MRLPPEQNIKALTKEAHQQDELKRLRAGFDGCGCPDCQELYKGLDLSGYGNRVIQAAGVIIITAGKPGADLWGDYHLPEDFYTTFFTQPVAQEPVSKIVGGIFPLTEETQAQEFDIFETSEKPKKPRGRPRKQEGEQMSRVTGWRMRKRMEEELQGALAL